MMSLISSARSLLAQGNTYSPLKQLGSSRAGGFAAAQFFNCRWTPNFHHPSRLFSEFPMLASFILCVLTEFCIYQLLYIYHALLFILVGSIITSSFTVLLYLLGLSRE